MSTQRTKLSPGRILAIVIAVIVLVPILFIVIGFWPGSTRGIEAVANKFQPGEGWVLESEQINPPMLICLQGDCGEVRKVWRGQASIFKNCSEFAQLSHSVTGEFDVNIDTVKFSNNDAGLVWACDIHRSIEYKDVTFSYRDYDDEQSMLILQVENK